MRGRVEGRLVAAGCVAADEEAEELIGAAPDRRTLEDWVARRERGEPLAWIVGVAPFCGQLLVVERGVFVPRPQSEELARRGAELLRVTGRAADLCTGSGAIARHLVARVPTATVVGVDIDRCAVACARRNGVTAVLGDLAGGLGSEAFDVVTAVAPYVPTSALGLLPADVRRYEPPRALDGGDDGLDLVRRVVWGAARVLRREGWLLLEVGGEQDRALAPVLEEAGFAAWVTWLDDEGSLRGLAARKQGAVRRTGRGRSRPRRPKAAPAD